MDAVLKENLKIMAQLQFTDNECESIQKKLAGVDERVNSLGTQLTVFDQQVDQAEAQLDLLRKQYRSDESEVKTIETQITKSDDKLRSVKTNKEYQGMLKEIDELQFKKAAIEDRMIETLEQIEAAERQVAVLQADLKEMQREITGQQEEIRRIAEEQRLELEELIEERQQIWAGLGPKLQKMYARSKQLGNGIAVAAVEEAVCLACRMNIPPQAYIELQRMDAMAMCPHCQRIIYPKAIVEEDLG